MALSVEIFIGFILLQRNNSMLKGAKNDIHKTNPKSNADSVCGTSWTD